MAKINKIQLDGASYDIRGLIPEVVSSLPVTGEEDMLYLTPAAEPGTRDVTVETDDGYAQLANAPADAPISLTELDGNAEQNALPSAYQAVEYIQSSGTQRIETDYIFTQDDYIEFKFAPMAMGDVAMFGFYESNSAACEIGLLQNEIRGNASPVGQGYTYTTGTTYTAVSQNGQWSIGGTSFGWQRNTTTTLKSFIFARNYSDPASYKPSSMKFYSLLIKRSGATVYNFIPCYRKSDGVIGIYETVNGKFFTNAGTGSFTKSNDTTVGPTPDAPQAIKTVTGGQTVQIAPNQKNLADPQVFIDWVNRTRALCFQYGWGNVSTRPNYGTYYGRNHVVYYEGSTLYTVRDAMTDPTFDEAMIIFDKTGTGQAFKPQTSYTISGEIYGSSANCNLQIRYTDGSYNFTPNVTPNQWTRFTFASNSAKTIKDISLTWAGGNTRLDLDTFQIEEGASATDYTPFVKTTYPINLGKNLIQADRTLGAPSDTSWSNTTKRTFNFGEYSVGITRNNYYSGPAVVTVVEDNGTYTLTPTTGGYGIGLPIKLSPNTKYIVSADMTNQENAEIAVGFYEHDGTYIGQVEPQKGEKSCMFVTPSNCDFADIILSCTANQTCTYSNIQLELGGLATPYAPYKTPIELAKIGTYQDYIWNDDGTWKIHKEIGKVVFDGSEAGWYYQDAGTLTNRFAIPVSSYGLASGAQGLCNNNEFVTSNVSADRQLVGIVNSVLYYRINKTTLASTTVSDFKAWLASNNTIVYTALTTPTDTEITDASLIGQLDFVASLCEGINNIMLIPSAGAQGEMTLAATEYDPQQRYDEYVWVEGEGYEKVGYGSVDTALSLGSTNPVQNKVITEVIGDVESILQILNNGNGV